MENKSLIAQYKQSAETHSQIDYANKNSVKRGNKAAEKMREIALLAKYDETLADELISLLYLHHPASLWAAHHTLELLPHSEEIECRALEVIQREIGSSGLNSYGEKIWLDEYKKSKKAI